VLFILDASEHCGYALDDQVRLQEEIQGLVDVPVVTVANKADIRRIEDYPAISTLTGEGWRECSTCCSDTEWTPGKRACKNRPDQKTSNRAAVQGGRPAWGLPLLTK